MKDVVGVLQNKVHSAEYECVKWPVACRAFHKSFTEIYRNIIVQGVNVVAILHFGLNLVLKNMEI